MGRKDAYSGKGLTMAEVYTVENALPVEDLFVEERTVTIGVELFLDLCIEYGRKLAMEDFIKVTKYNIEKHEARAILGMEEEEEDE